MIIRCARQILRFRRGFQHLREDAKAFFDFVGLQKNALFRLGTSFKVKTPAALRI